MTKSRLAELDGYSCITEEEELELLALLELEEREASQNKLAHYAPYAKQKEFHAAGALFIERLFSAGNQLGKTWAGAFEVAMHLTGRYPDWWEGRRFDKPTTWIVGSESKELTVKGAQRLLIGPPEIEADWGTGAIPKDCLGKPSKSSGVANAIASVSVKHVSGGTSILKFASYDQGRAKWQADTVDGVWFDEEPPYDIYFEGITRTNAKRGIIMLTFTPLKGMSETVARFYPVPKFAGCHVTTMTIYDVEHYSLEEKEAIIAKYPAHERDARTKGIPMLGSGRIFPLSDDAIVVEPFVIPDSWPRIRGTDFGWDHPSAHAWIAWDRDSDTIYIYDTLRIREATPNDQAEAVNARGPWIPGAWPHDGLQHDKGSGEQLAEIYRAANINMLWERAMYPEVSEGDQKISRSSVEAGILDMLERMKSGRLKVFAGLEDWLQEFRMYHRKDGKIVKLSDDLMSATRYGMMMLRYAACPPPPQRSTSARRSQNWQAG